MSDHLTVYYIAGEGRSGSTVLSTTLADYAGFSCVGEIHSIWRALLTNELCSCGQPFYTCDFWAAVGKAAFGGWDQLDIAHAVELNRALTRQRYMPRLAVPFIRKRHAHEIAVFAKILIALYSAVCTVSGRDAIVDSSKGVPYFLLLRQVDGLDLRIVHLVRDSRGVAYSWAKQHIAQPQFAHLPSLAEKPMPSRTVARSAWRWLAANIAFEVIGRLTSRRVRVKYEALATDPTSELELVLAKLGTPAARDAQLTEGLVHEPANGFDLAGHHVLGGNPLRFQNGRQGLRKDDEWRLRMPARSCLVVTLITWPLLVPYRYVSGRPLR